MPVDTLPRPLHAAGAAVVRLPVAAIGAADSPRSAGVDVAHAQSLAQLETDLPPIVVHRTTMRVVDGMHRLAAARLRGDHEIAATLFDGGADEAFLLAVRLNVAHGKALPIADRRAAALRIVRSHPQLSDRAVAVAAGLSAKVVGSLRREVGGPQAAARVGRDGRLRPVDHAAGRRAAAELLAVHPDATLRRIARDVGISVETARRVRQRLAAGEDPVLDRRTRARTAEPAERPMTVELTESDPSDALRTLLDTIQRDPALRYTESGRMLLRWLGPRVLLPDEVPAVVRRLPPHCRPQLGSMARLSAAAWVQLALSLEDADPDTDAATDAAGTAAPRSA